MAEPANTRGQTAGERAVDQLAPEYAAAGHAAFEQAAAENLLRLIAEAKLDDAEQSAIQGYEGFVDEERRPDARLEHSDDVLTDTLGLLPEPDHGSDETEPVDGVAAASRGSGRSLAPLLGHIGLLPHRTTR